MLLVVAVFGCSVCTKKGDLAWTVPRRNSPGRIKVGYEVEIALCVCPVNDISEPLLIDIMLDDVTLSHLYCFMLASMSLQ